MTLRTNLLKNYQKCLREQRNMVLRMWLLPDLVGLVRATFNDSESSDTELNEEEEDKLNRRIEYSILQQLVYRLPFLLTGLLDAVGCVILPNAH